MIRQSGCLFIVKELYFSDTTLVLIMSFLSLISPLKNTSPSDDNIDFFDIDSEDLKGDISTFCLFIVYLDEVLRASKNLLKDNDLVLEVCRR